MQEIPSIQPEYKNSVDYQNMLWLLKDKKNLEAFSGAIVDLVDQNPESFSQPLKDKVDIFKQAYAENKENPPQALYEFAEKLLDEVFLVVFSSQS